MQLYLLLIYYKKAPCLSNDPGKVESIFFCYTTMRFPHIGMFSFLAELSCPRSEAPWVRKFCNLCIREILVVPWPYVRPTARPRHRYTNIKNSIKRYGNPNATQGFIWNEIAWPPGLLEITGSTLRAKMDLLACMFCFPKTGHVIILLRTVSFKFRLTLVHMYAYR